MYSIRQYRITNHRLLRLAVFILAFWLVSSLLSPLLAQGTVKTPAERAAALKSRCFIKHTAINISFTAVELSAVSIRLFSIVGKEEASFCRNKIATPGTHVYTYSITHLKPGIYFCAVEVGSSQVVHKLCVP